MWVSVSELSARNLGYRPCVPRKRPWYVHLLIKDLSRSRLKLLLSIILLWYVLKQKQFATVYIKQNASNCFDILVSKNEDELSLGDSVLCCCTLVSESHVVYTFFQFIEYWNLCIYSMFFRNRNKRWQHNSAQWFQNYICNGSIWKILSGISCLMK